MNITVSLNTVQINDLIDRLMFFQEHMTEELVNILCIEGSEVANIAYGNMASADGGVVSADKSGSVGKIIATGSNEDELLIAEFGAGDATIYPAMEFETTELDAYVFPGAYSLFKGTRDYYNFGSWKFGGQWYTEVPARHGMFDAKLYIMQNYVRLANEVIRID